MVILLLAFLVDGMLLAFFAIFGDCKSGIAFRRLTNFVVSGLAFLTDKNGFVFHICLHHLACFITLSKNGMIVKKIIKANAFSAYA
jgi:hypothetical protein